MGDSIGHLRDLLFIVHPRRSPLLEVPVYFMPSQNGTRPTKNVLYYWILSIRMLHSKLVLIILVGLKLIYLVVISLTCVHSTIKPVLNISKRLSTEIKIMHSNK